ncbi:MAG: HAD-IIIA family hydrolase [Bacteroidia bacterium]|nr:HAD-IIIA family hydrolase [Bacteroidia bacterium]
MQNFKEKLAKISCFIFDVDGVLTNGQLIIMPDGELLRSMNIKDGYAMQLAIKKGYKIAIISGGKSEGVPQRLQRLGITEIYMQTKNKVDVYKQLLDKWQLKNEQVCYMGDDVPDVAVMQLAGIATCPADACQEVKQVAIYQSIQSGGNGCVRDIIEQAMRLQNTWSDL